MEVSDAPSIAGPGHNLATVGDILRDRFTALMEEVEKLAKEATEAKNGLGIPPVITTDEQRDRLVALGLEASKLAKRCDETRLSTTKPLRDEVDETNKFFQAITVRPQNVKAAFEAIVGKYDQQKRDEERKRLAAEAEAAQAEARRKLEEAAAAPQHSVVSDVVLQEAARAEHQAKHLESQALASTSGPTKTDAGTISQRTNWTFRITDAAKIDLNKLRPHFGIADIEKALRAYVRAHRDTAPIAGVEIFPDTKTQFRG